MKLKFLCCGLLVLAVSFGLFAAPSAPAYPPLKNATILIIRHAEKPDEGYGLTPAGEARAQAYVNYFKTFTVNGQPLKLTCLFAAADSKKSHRPRLTIEPTSQALGLPIDTRFKDKDVQGLANDIESQAHGTGILIAWHHEKIPDLLQALGADPAKVIPNSKWPEDVYGWLIELRYNGQGQLSEIKRIDEKLMPDDSK